MLGKAKLT